MNTIDHLAIVTGASRGLGLAMVTAWRQQPGTLVLGMARGDSPWPIDAGHEHWALDLTEARAAAERLGPWLASRHGNSLRRVTLVNNAATVPPPGPLETQPLDTLMLAARVGLEAPLLLSAAFLAATASWTAQRRILHVSSGLGRKAMAGTAAYCAVKAGLDHLARAQALEQSQLAAQGFNAARVVSIAPGVIDTPMQVTLRTADATRFPDRARFLSLSSEGQLQSPSDTAQRLLHYLEREDFGLQAVADIRD